MNDKFTARIDLDLENRSKNGAFIYSAAWLLIGIGTGFWQKQPFDFYLFLGIFAFLGIIRLATIAWAKSLRLKARKKWIVLQYFHVLTPTIIISSIFAASGILPEYEDLFIYLLMTIFAMQSGGIFSFSPNPKLSVAYLLALVIPPFIGFGFISGELYLETSMLIIYGLFMLGLSRRFSSEYYQLIEQQEKLEQLNNLDGLTNIYNRRYFDKKLHDLWSMHLRSQNTICLLIIDIDHFKKINDTHGHAVGDEVIIRIADLLKVTCKRNTDIVARIGGEEFGVILSCTKQEPANKVAENIRQLVNELNFSGADGNFSVSVSIGASSCVPQLSLDTQTLFKLADDCLYKAKHEGRNRLVSQVYLNSAMG